VRPTRLAYRWRQSSRFAGLLVLKT
jgi:hypothetical protein